MSYFLKRVKDLVRGFAFGKRVVPISDELYDQLLKEANDDEDWVPGKLATILSQRFKAQAEQEKKQCQEEERKKELAEEFKELDRALYATLNRTLSIGITDRLRGHEREYILLNYELSTSDGFLSLELERNGEYFPISFHNIYEVRNNLNGDILKVWIYMETGNWRFYLDFDKEIAKGAVDSGRLS